MTLSRMKGAAAEREIFGIRLNPHKLQVVFGKKPDQKLLWAQDLFVLVFGPIPSLNCISVCKGFPTGVPSQVALAILLLGCAVEVAADKDGDSDEKNKKMTKTLKKAVVVTDIMQSQSTRVTSNVLARNVQSVLPLTFLGFVCA